MSVGVFLSRYTPRARASSINFRIGEKVKYKSKTDGIVDVIIDSELMSHDECDKVFEVIWPDGNRYAIRADNIVWWEGKTE